jgi:hypothetical protein
MEQPKKSLAATKALLEETKLRTALHTLKRGLQVKSGALPKPTETIKLKSNTTVAEALKVRNIPRSMIMSVCRQQQLHVQL